MIQPFTQNDQKGTLKCQQVWVFIKFKYMYIGYTQNLTNEKFW